MSDIFDWKPLRMNINTGAATFGVVVPAMMSMEIKEIAYSNRTAAVNRVQISQIPSGTVRPASAIVIDDQTIAASSPYSPRIPIRTMQEEHVLEASSDAGPITANLVYRLGYGRP